MTKVMTVDRLKAFSDAWDEGDAEKIMEFFAEACVFRPSIEDVPNAEYRGKAEVRAAIQNILDRDCGYISSSGAHYVFGKQGYCEWYLSHPDDQQSPITKGCDFFTFEGDLITLKDAFRKTQSRSS